MRDWLAALPLSGFILIVPLYTSFQALSPTPQVGFSFAGRIGATALVALFVLSALGCAWLVLRAGAGLPREPSRSMLAAWIGAALISALAGLAPLDGLAVVAMMGLCACFHFALRRAYARSFVGRCAVVTYLFAGAFFAAAGIVMALAHVPPGLYAATHGRAAGFFVSANQFAEFLTMFAFVSLGVGLGARELWLRRLGFGNALLGGIGLGLTFSRENWSGAAVGSIALAWALGRRRLALALLAAGALGVAFFALRPFPHHDPSDTFSRLRTLEGGLRVVQLFPLTGAGPVAYWHAYPAIRPVNGPAPGTFGALHPHDVYVSLAGETGVVGVAAALFGWLRFGSGMRRRLATAPAPNRRFALAICAGFVALLVAGIFDTIAVVQMTFLWIPFTALALVAAESGVPPAGSRTS